MVMPLRRAEWLAALEESHRVLLCSGSIVSRIYFSASKVQKYRIHCLLLLFLFWHIPRCLERGCHTLFTRRRLTA